MNERPESHRKGASPAGLHRGWALGIVLVLVAAAAMLAVLVQRDRARRARAAALAMGSERQVEARLSAPAADVYRPYSPSRGSGASEPPVPTDVLLELLHDNDYRGLAAAYVLNNRLEDARAALAPPVPPSPDVGSDLALIAAKQGRVNDALELFAQALRARPDHPQALWNKGLLLRDLGLSLTAADAFDRVAALKEPGWSEEAARRAQALREGAARQQTEWEAVLREGRQMVSTGEPLRPELISASPGLARLYFYDAIRAAPSRERVLGLLGVAEELDRLDGGTPLAAYVRRVAASDFKARRPLAETYARLALGQLPAAELEGFLARLRGSREEDILLGALLFSPNLSRMLDLYRQLASAADDPWFALLAEEKQAAAELDHGDAAQAELRLRSALRRCDASARLDYRCEALERRLSFAYDVLHRPVEARQHALNALRRSARGRTWSLQWPALYQLGEIATHVEQLAQAHAYFDEYLARTSAQGCVAQESVHDLLAVAHQEALDVAGARVEVDQAARCGQPLSIAGAFALSDLARTLPRPEDAEALRRSLEAQRAAAELDPGVAAFLEHIEGRFEIERDRARGQSLLQRAISDAQRLPESDVNALKARTYSYTSLLFDAGKHGEYAAALDLFTAELGGPPLGACVLAVTAEDERTLVVARDAAGQVRGQYNTGRRQPLAKVDGLIPPALVEVLRSCPSVDVLARPPVQGRAGLLPDEIAWSYRVSRSARARASVPARRLIITDIVIPEELRQQLQPLSPSTEPSASSDLVVLRDWAATPSRVLGAMAGATEITFNTHGRMDLGVSDASFLVLSPDEDGRYTLTARDVQRARLEGSPVVVLAACYSGETTRYLHEEIGLPLAFIRAGARVVLAATEQIPDREAGLFFEPVLARIRADEAPALALRDERRAWLARGGGRWVDSVLLFQ